METLWIFAYFDPYYRCEQQWFVYADSEDDARRQASCWLAEGDHGKIRDIRSHPDGYLLYGTIPVPGEKPAMPLLVPTPHEHEQELARMYRTLWIAFYRSGGSGAGTFVQRNLKGFLAVSLEDAQTQVDQWAEAEGVQVDEFRSFPYGFVAGRAADGRWLGRVRIGEIGRVFCQG